MKKSIKVILRKDPDYELILQPSGRKLGSANWFLRAIETRGLSPATSRAYAYDLLIFYRWWLSYRKKAFKKLNTFDLQCFIEHQRKLNAKPASINRRLSALENYYRFCFGKTIAKSNRVALPMPYYRRRGRPQLGVSRRARGPIERRLRVKEPKPLVRPLEAEELSRFLKSLRRYRDQAMTLLMLLCGLRSAEVLSLKIADVDFLQRRIRVFGKGGKERMLPLPDRCVRVLNQYLELERPDICKTDRLFVVLHGNTRGAPLTIAGLRAVFRWWRIRTGLKNARPHNFRHAFGTNMARYGVSLPVLQKMLGHAEFKHTLRYVNLAMTDVAQEYSKALTQIEQKYGKAIPT